MQARLFLGSLHCGAARNRSRQCEVAPNLRRSAQKLHETPQRVETANLCRRSVREMRAAWVAMRDGRHAQTASGRLSKSLFDALASTLKMDFRIKGADHDSTPRP
jgi:hypothetical protein